MTSFKQELDQEVERLKTEHAKKTRKPYRYKNGYRVTDTIRMYCKKSAPSILEFHISYDLVHQMWLWRDYFGAEHKAPEKMPRWVVQNSNVEFVPFTDGMPGCLMRMERPFNYRPNGTRLTQKPNAWNFRTAITARKLGLKNGIDSGRIIRTIPWDDQHGYIMMFEPADMLHGTNMDRQGFREFAENVIAVGIKD